MADQFHDSTPAVGNTVAADIPDIAESLGFIKDCFQELCANWSNTDSSALTLDKHYAQTKSPSASSGETISSLTADYFYRLVFILSFSTDAGLYLRFGNSGGVDSGSNYDYTVIEDDTERNGSGTTTIQLNGNQTDDYVQGTIDFISVPSDDTKIIGKSHITMFEATGDTHTVCTGGFSYEGGSTVDRVQLYPSTGTMTGSIRLIEMK